MMLNARKTISPNSKKAAFKRHYRHLARLALHLFR
jgi:hypothetical protein